MSMAIDVTKVRAVLLADGWHKIAENSFDLDSYEYLRGNEKLHNGGSGTGPLGFKLKDDAGYFLYGPLTAILASRTS